MRLIHTSDWHLGRSFHQVGLLGAQASYLDHLVDVVRREKVDAVLVSGDVYDRAMPAPDTVALLSQALHRLVDAGAQVIISSGNHDSAARLGFGAGLLERTGVHLRTSLADVARYLYDTDLRDATRAGYNGTTTADNCTVTGTDDDTGVSFTRNVCENNVFVTPTDNNTRQHITTFTLGLGMDGNLQFQDDYQTTTDSNSDFYKLRTGTGTPTVNWPVPVSGAQTTVDDLWHAAVSGQGRYFSPKDPAELGSGLARALASITAKTGAGAAAATSTLSPVSGDNFAYVASYTTAKWTGNLERRGIYTATGEVSETAVWCAESILAGACSGTRSSATVNGALVNYCSTTLPACPTGSTRNGDNCEQAGPTRPSDFTLVGTTCTRPARPGGGTLPRGATRRAGEPRRRRPPPAPAGAPGGARPQRIEPRATRPPPPRRRQTATHPHAEWDHRPLSRNGFHPIAR